MKKYLYPFMALAFVGCMRDIKEDVQYPIEQSLTINEATGLKFEGPSISDASQFNFKVETGGTYYIVVKDHLKNVISKSEIKTNIGDNVLRFYTNAIPDGDYFIEFKDPQDNIIESNKITIQ
jgi:hypothetical protein